MHNYTKLNFEEAIRRYTSELNEELSKNSGRARDISYGTLDSIKIGQTYIDKILSDVFNALKEANQPISDFPELEKEIIDLTKKEYTEIFGRMVGKFNCMPGLVSDGAITKTAETFESINRKIQLLQSELRFKRQASIPAVTVNVRGDVGVINAGQVYGNIQVTLEQMRHSDMDAVADAFERLAAAISESGIKEQERIKQMQSLDFLMSECQIPKENRNEGAADAVVTALSVAANLSTVWANVGPQVLKALGLG